MTYGFTGFECDNMISIIALARNKHLVTASMLLIFSWSDWFTTTVRFHVLSFFFSFIFFIIVFFLNVFLRMYCCHGKWEVWRCIISYNCKYSCCGLCASCEIVGVVDCPLLGTSDNGCARSWMFSNYRISISFGWARAMDMVKWSIYRVYGE